MMADTVNKARQWGRQRVAEARRPEHRVKLAKVLVDASRSSLRHVLADHPGLRATAATEAYDLLQVALTSLQESLSD
jgi:hypothetical protein